MQQELGYRDPFGVVSAINPRTPKFPAELTFLSEAQPEIIALSARLELDF